MLVAEHIDQFRIIHRHDRLKGLAAAAAGEMAPNVRVRDGYVFHIISVDLFEELAKWKDLLSAGRSVLHDLIQQHGRRQNQDPEQNGFSC